MLHIVLSDAMSAVLSTNIDVHLHLWISAVVGQCVDMRPRMWHVVGQESAFIEISTLIDVFLSVGIEFYHHCAVHF